MKKILKAATVLLACAQVFTFRGEVAQAAKENTYNILLIGADRRDTSWNGNSDSMILVTVNDDAQAIFATSFMRDLYAVVNGGVHKLNYAYALGGAELLEETLETEYGVKIDNYVAVDFDMMAEVVDLLGGVDMELNSDEIGIVGVSDSQLVGGSTYHLDGAQTVTFSRIRYVGNNDYERTERQRRVLQQLSLNVKDLTAEDIQTLMKKILEISYNDINILDIVNILAIYQKAQNYPIVENRVPYDGMFYSNNEILTPNSMDETVAKLTGLIYADDSTVIRKVQEALNAAGYDCGVADGIMGANTAGAITSYQNDNGLTANGAIDAELLDSMGIER